MKAAWVVLAALPLGAQSWYPKHSLTVGAGAGLPRGELARPFNNSSAVSVGYGYRWHRYFQADVGLDTVFRAARIRDFLRTQIGYLRIQDYQFFLPFGGRAILPLASGRVLVSGGVGGAYLRYSERLSQPSEYLRVACPVCRSRSGWGYYGLLGGRLALDSGRRFWVGAASKVYRGHTEGDPLGDVPGVRTQDRWVKIFGEFGLSF